MTTELFCGGRIYSPSAPDATAMAVTDGIISWIGEDRTGRALHPGVPVIDLAGSFVGPAFVDTHVHVTDLGLSLIGLDLSRSTSVEDCVRMVREHAASSEDDLIWGHGWDESTWSEQRPPTTAELDAAAPGRAVYLTRVDSHSAAVSTRLRFAASAADATSGYSEQSPLTADAHHRARQTARSLLTADTRRRARAAALDDAAAHGIVAVHECAGPVVSGIDDFRELMNTEHGVEIRGYWGELADTAERARELLEETGAHGLAGDIFVDGSLGSHTAWLSSPYADGPGTGVSYADVDAIAAHIAACTTAGIQAGFHVIGDAAVSAAVTAFGRVVADLGTPAVASCGHRLEHLAMVSAQQADLLASWGVIASMQPAFDAAWGGADGLYAARLGAERAAELHPFARLASAGVSLAFGSDAPVTSLDPWATVRAAANHRTPGSSVSPRAAFSAATRGAWRAGGVRDGLAGTLVPGAPASFAVWDVDELVVRAPKDSVQRWSTDPRAGVAPLPSLEASSVGPRCSMTVHRGRVVHEQ
ncbi:amidohydrolase [Rhodococcus fascians]|nr:amidohydrolase [Rhodococcus fascians]MBY3825016.1 amidohydrolase [Rhodococcus fascians]MBY3835538.1 amidohydrolase [Rhodococcus fascians]MBY3864750.1 amidohydrolase [Rhodococcus fascians]MBY3884221.1 amidohydrolase [Rhodococcus fascians]